MVNLDYNDNNGDLLQENVEVKRGDIIIAEYYFNGSWRLKPVLVIQNDIGNKVSPLLIVAPIVTADQQTGMGPMQVNLSEQTQAATGLRQSTILLNIILTLEKKQFKEKIGRLPDFLLKDVDKGLMLSLGLNV